ncbi:MAG: molybdenum cofactor guanylyltransferase [Candidatus Neomarinimicrobiota bacterium]
MIQVSAFILIGGDSSRFGYPKWKASIGGMTILERIWKQCEKCEHRFIIGKKIPTGSTKPFIKDILDIQAPINGLYTALKKSKTNWILLLSCDLPLISEKILLHLWNHNDKSKDIIVPRIKGRLEPTCAFYHKNVINQCFKRIESNKFGLNKFILNTKFNPIDMDAQSEQFLNMNTKNDMSLAEKILRL